MSTTKLGDEFLRIPKLEATGANWVVYRDRFLISIEARGLGDHLDGTAECPTDPHPPPMDGSAQTLTPEQKTKMAEYLKELKTWKQEEAIVKQQLASTISDTLFLKIRSLPTAEEIWTALEGTYQVKSRMFSVDLRRRIAEERCADKGDVRAHFAKLRLMREELSSLGFPLDDSEFYAIVMGSLPPSYDAYVSTIDATFTTTVATYLSIAASSGSTSYTAPEPSPDNLMSNVTEEYERRLLKQKASGKQKNDADNVALYSNDSKGPREGVECFNCKRPGHYKSECWRKGGGKEGQRPERGPRRDAKGKGKRRDTKSDDKEKSKEKSKDTKDAASKAAADDLPAEAWMASIEPDWEGYYVDDFADSTPRHPEHASSISDFSDDFEVWLSDNEGNETDDDHSTPGLQAVSDSESEDDYSEDSEDAPEFDLPERDAHTPSDEVFIGTTHIVPLEEEAYQTTYTVKELTTPSDNADIDLYDSGATRHMSGARHRFTNFVQIPPRPISAADNRSFSATGMGDIILDVPNGDQGVSQVILKDVLYAPSMRVTLVSISRIVDGGASVLFYGTTCRIFNSARTRIGMITVHGGLYRVYAKRPDAANYSGKPKLKLSIDKLHQYLGHVSHERARHLVANGERSTA